MKHNIQRLTLGSACALLFSVFMAHSQTTPLPPGLTRAPSSANKTTPPPAESTGYVPTAKAPPAAPVATSGANLLGIPATTPAATTGGSTSKTNSTRLNFNGADSLILLMAYAEATGRTLIQAADVPKATITLKSQAEVELSKEEYLEAIEKTLAMNGIVLVPDGTKFLRVFAKGKVRTEGIKTIMDEPESLHPEMGRTISQMITFKFLAVTEGQKALEGFKKPDGLFQVFERTNTILVTDTQENINRMLEIVKFIDKPIEITDEVHVRVIKYAKADDIKKRIEELVAESQKQLQAKEEIKASTSGAPGTSRSTVTSTTSSLLGSRPLPPGLIRPTTPSTPAPVINNETLSAMVNDADRGMIRGKVQVIADERSNKLIVVTRPENMNFFDKIIEVLDVPTAPDIQVKIIRLQHATADSSGTKDGEKGIADILNELIGNASASKSTTSKSTTTSNRRTSNYPGPGGSQNLTSALPTPAPTPSTPSAAGTKDGSGKVGELSKENITILSDKRINGLIVMASPTDMMIIESLIKELDVELEQVIIETVLLQVQLTDTVKTGIDWLQQHVQTKNDVTFMGGGGGGVNNTVANLADMASAGAKIAGAKYYFLFDNLDLRMVVEASKTDSRTKVLQSPVLMTVNNKEATLESTDMVYLYKGVRYAGSYNYGTEVPDFEQRDFGITIKVTPRISPNGNVTLSVDQKFETQGPDQFIPGAGGTSSTNGGSSGSSGGNYPTISTSKLQADVSVKSGQTVMLGGLVKTSSIISDSGIPILKDIPWIGRYLFGKTENKDESKETMVFLTPYVVKGSSEAQNEARRRMEGANLDGIWTKGWSDSNLAESPKTKDALAREQRRIELLKKEAEAREALKELYKENNMTPPTEKGTTPAPTSEKTGPQETTVKGFGQMRVIEEKTEPLLTTPVPEKAPVAENP
jgi:general secretion pathway protein D